MTREAAIEGRPDRDGAGSVAESGTAGNGAAQDEPADNPDTHDTPTVSAVRVAIGAVIALGVVALLIYSIGRRAGFGELERTFRGATWQWLVLCVVGELGVFAGYAGVFRTAVAFEGGPRIERGRSVSIVMASFALTQLVAAGGAAGLAFTYWAMRQIGLSRHKAGVRMIGMNTAVYLVFATIGWLAAWLALLTGEVSLAVTVPWLVAVPVVVALAGFFTAAGRVERWTNPCGGRIRNLLAVGVEAAWWVRRATQRPDGRGVFAWAALYWAGDVLSLWAALHAFGADVTPVGVLIVYVTGYLAQSIPIPFIATGGVDAATTFSLTLIGVPVEIAVLSVVAHRVFAFWIPLLPGLWSAVRLLRPTVVDAVTIDEEDGDD